jgi:hypothetical protein
MKGPSTIIYLRNLGGKDKNNTDPDYSVNGCVNETEFKNPNDPCNKVLISDDSLAKPDCSTLENKQNEMCLAESSDIGIKSVTVFLIFGSLITIFILTYAVLKVRKYYNEEKAKDVKRNEKDDLEQEYKKFQMMK